jgi:hypothetical protein
VLLVHDWLQLVPLSAGWLNEQVNLHATDNSYHHAIQRLTNRQSYNVLHDVIHAGYWQPVSLLNCDHIYAWARTESWPNALYNLMHGICVYFDIGFHRSIRKICRHTQPILNTFELNCHLAWMLNLYTEPFIDPKKHINFVSSMAWTYTKDPLSKTLRLKFTHATETHRTLIQLGSYCQV